MASHFKGFFQPLSPENDGVVENMKFIQSRVSPVQWEEDISNSASVCLNFFPNDNGSCAKQELQTLWEMFTSWLKPEEQTKEQMISQLVLEQFRKIGHSKDEFAVKELWELSGRNLGNLMQGLTDECLKPPVMVHVSMHGQEALFTENMTLKEVIEHFKEQQLVTVSTLENERTPLPIYQERLLTTDNFHYHTEGAVSDEIPLDLRTWHDAARYQEESQSEDSSRDVLMVQVQPGISSRPVQTEDIQNHAANCTYDGHHKRLHRDTNSNLSVHKKVQKKERSFVCKTCHKGFYTVSVLRVHEIIHKEEKPFICPTCKRPFSHKATLKAHKRIHTGEKPYTCSNCQRSFRQSSTYHRHQRNCLKSN
ncbi:zinc finger and SCAN domain-containing protein 4-like [Microtus pennsylvanicus]|uniref:zinc finger and SCAN domain-containing protein 4-like n=1 Tax=Microtus pennsylvanicus TaxID=10058 RepID=UPI003F6C29E3